MSSLITATGHGLTTNDPFRFANLVPDNAGPDESTTYYVLATDLDANHFRFSDTPGGTAFTLTNPITDGSIVDPDSYVAIDDGIMSPPDPPDAPASCVLSSTAVLAPDGTVASRLTITITQPTNATLRHTVVTVTGGSNTEKVVIPVGQTTGTIAFVVPGVTYTGTAIAYDTFGLASSATVSSGHVAAGDTTAPSNIAWLSIPGTQEMSIAMSWEPSTATDFDHYEFQVDDDVAFGSPLTYIMGSSNIFINATPGTWHTRVRAVDHTGNASAWTSDTPVNVSYTERVENSTATVVIDSSGITIEDGALTLKDEFGETVLVASGFSGTWSDYVALGLYNAAFRAGSTGALVEGRLASLPYWLVDYSNVSGSATFSRTADTAWPGGAYIRYKPGGTSDILELLSDKVGVTGGKEYVVSYIYAAAIAGASNLRVTTRVDWYRASGSFISSSSSFVRETGTDLDAGGVTVPFGPIFSPDRGRSEFLQAPANASHAIVSWQVQEIGTHNAATDFRLAFVSLQEDPYGEEFATGREVAFQNLGVLTDLSVGNNLQVDSDADIQGDLHVAGDIDLATGILNGKQMSILGPYTVSNVAGTAGPTGMDVGVLGPGAGGGTPNIRMPWNAEVVGMSVRGSAGRTAGTVTFDVNRNGTQDTAVQCVIDGTNTTTISDKTAPGTGVSITAGQTVGILYTSASFTPAASVDYTAFLFVLIDYNGT